MSLSLIWNDDAKPYADRDILQQATIMAYTHNSEPSYDRRFEISQRDMVTAFRLLVARDYIDHTQITLRVQQLVVTFDRYGTLEFPAGWPVPKYADDLLCNVMMEGRFKKRAEEAARSVD